MKFYAYLPGYIKRPFDGVNTDIMRGRIAAVIMDSVEAYRLYGKMVRDLNIVLIEHEVSDPWSDERVIILRKFKAYIDGEYTIFEPDRFIPGVEHNGEIDRKNVSPEEDCGIGHDAAEVSEKPSLIERLHETQKVVEEGGLRGKGREKVRVGREMV